MSQSEVSNVVCTFCGSLCDNLVVTVEDNEITKVKNACRISKTEFMHATEDRTVPRIKGEEVSYEEAVNEAVDILKDTHYPLIYGLSSTSNEGQRAAIKLAESIGASIDSTSSVCHGPGTLSKQLVGAVGATLGEVKNRSDLILFWGCNPIEAHPRHAKRYSMLPDGLFIDSDDKETIVFDVRETPTARLADHFYQVQPNSDFEILMVLRALLEGEELDIPAGKESIGGIELDEIYRLADKLKNAEYGTLFFGMGLTMTRGKHMNTSAAISLVRDLNQYTRFVLIPMRGHGNVAGSEKTLGWQTGYPFGVNFSRGYPRYNPGEFTAVDLLGRREVDAAVIVASDPAASLPYQAVEYLKEIPTVVLDPHQNLTTEIAQVILPAGITGITAPGTVYRMDNVPLEVRPVLEDEWPTDEEVLTKIEEGVKNA